MGDRTADQIVKPSRPVLTRLLCGTGRVRNTMPKPLICVYCREPIALRRDNYLLRPPEHTTGGDYGQPTWHAQRPTGMMRRPIPLSSWLMARRRAST
jgi:hypothetical protein